MTRTRIHVAPEFFGEREKVLLEYGSLAASTFRFESGVCGLRLKNALGDIVMLPFQGQQIWSATFNGRDLTMVSMFEEPQATRRYLESYGGFLLHCGLTAMGVPAAGDTHPLHGELPNAPFRKAHVVAGEDGKGSYLGLGGQYRHTVAFNHNYLAEPLVKLYEDSSLFEMSLSVTNLKNTAMELMYLAHVNFRPVDNGRLVYSAPCTPERVRVRASIPSHLRPQAGYAEFLSDLKEHPERHNLLTPGLAFDPEVVFTIDYHADEAGWAHSMQLHLDGSADYLAHRPGELPKGVRWICRTPDQDALGLVLPATAEPEGYQAEKAKGNLKILPPRATFRCTLRMGALTPTEAASMAQKIAHMLGTVAGAGAKSHL
ncbi:MAG: DUF4432 family protein [Deinococcota bacterium]|nr:DUF4432 family protein [Deinococcota bacterium]